MMKILIADDHAVVRRGLKQILAEELDMVVFGEACNGQEVLKNVREQYWDIMILDITMPDRSGLEVLEEVKHVRPKLPVLVLSVHREELYAMRVLKAGAAGYINKLSAPGDLVKAVKKVIEGGKYISASLAERLATALQAGFENTLHETLSNREYQVMCLVASGKNVKEIAKELYLSVSAIRTYRMRILKKMKMKSNAELIHYAIKNRIIEE